VRFDRGLLLTALAYSLCHHVGSLPGGLGEVGDTRWADWLDLLAPYLVLLPAGAALAAAQVGRGRWLAFGVGALMYAQGHGIHLSSNSIGNVAPSPAVHLWDEVVGHVVWYAGVAVVFAVLAAELPGRPRPGTRTLVVASALALAVGGTWTTNAIGGSFAVPGLVVALALAWFGWRHRHGLALLVFVAFAPAAVALAAYLATVW
jgi:hypothetical protein